MLLGNLTSATNRCKRPSFRSKKNRMPKLQPRTMNSSVASMHVYSNLIASWGFEACRNLFTPKSPLCEKCSLRDEKPSWAFVGSNFSSFVCASFSLRTISVPIWASPIAPVNEIRQIFNYRLSRNSPSVISLG